MPSVVSQFHPRISYYEAAGMLKDGGNQLTLDPKAVADGQIRKLLESNFRPVVNPMHELMSAQFLNMMNHRNQQGELQRLAAMNNIGLAPVRDAVSGILNDPRADPQSTLGSLFENFADSSTWLQNVGRMLTLEPTVPLLEDERLAAAADAQRQANLKIELLEAQMRQKAEASGELFASVNRAEGGTLNLRDLGGRGAETPGESTSTTTPPPLEATHGFSGHSAHATSGGDGTTGWFSRPAPAPGPAPVPVVQEHRRRTRGSGNVLKRHHRATGMEL